MNCHALKFSHLSIDRFSKTTVAFFPTAEIKDACFLLKYEIRDAKLMGSVKKTKSWSWLPVMLSGQPSFLQ